jgi:hypothetical protein
MLDSRQKRAVGGMAYLTWAPNEARLMDRWHPPSSATLLTKIRAWVRLNECPGIGPFRTHFDKARIPSHNVVKNPHGPPQPFPSMTVPPGKKEGSTTFFAGVCHEL